MQRHGLRSIVLLVLSWPLVSASAAGCDTAGLRLPDGFCATVFAADTGQPRHIAVGPNGTVYANLGRAIQGHDLLALQDSNGDGRADRRYSFGQGGATGLTVHGNWLYAASLSEIRRYPIGGVQQPSADNREVVVRGLPQQRAHSARGLAIDNHDHLFVAIGAPSNACQKRDRVPGDRGQDPCPLLATYGGVWVFSASQPGQRFSARKRYASGVRNMFALAYDVPVDRLYGVQMGRDQLASLWPGRFSSDQSVDLPAEVLLRVERGDNFGWPYCYYDAQQKRNVLNPEYGGDGRKVGRCDRFKTPAAAYPAHWAPMAIVFYHANLFPGRYRGGAFIAFHGSWNRAPKPQAGFQVIYQSFAGDKPAGAWQPFAGPEGFIGAERVRSPAAATHRPAGLAIGPDGAMYISDDRGGTIYRVTYRDG